MRFILLYLYFFKSQQTDLLNRFNNIAEIKLTSAIFLFNIN